MSLTLTNRDAATEVFNIASAQPDGIQLASSSTTSSDSRVLKERFQRTGTKKPRGNLNYVRTKYDPDSGLTGKLSVDVTISAENAQLFTVDEVDDAITGVTSFFASDTDAANLLNGLPRS